MARRTRRGRRRRDADGATERTLRRMAVAAGAASRGAPKLHCGAPAACARGDGRGDAGEAGDAGDPQEPAAAERPGPDRAGTRGDPARAAGRRAGGRKGSTVTGTPVLAAAWGRQALRAIVAGVPPVAEVTNGPFAAGPRPTWRIGPAARLGLPMTHAKHPASVSPRRSSPSGSLRSTRRRARSPRSSTSTASCRSSWTASASSSARRYAALGIADGAGRMERFITTGITPEARAAHRRRAAGPRAARPADHPRAPVDPGRRTSRSTRRASASRPTTRSMRSFLGVPVAGQGPLRRQPVPHREGARRAVHRGRRAAASRCSPSTPASPSRTRGSTTRSSAWRSSRSGSGSARTSTTGSSRRSTPWACRWRMVPELVEDEAGRARGRGARGPRDRRAQPRDRRHPLVHPPAAARRWAGEEDPVEALARLGEELGMHAVVDLEVDLDERRGAAARPAARPPVGHPVHRARGAVQRRPPRRRDRGRCWSSTATATTWCCAIEDNGRGLRSGRADRAGRATAGTRASATCATAPWPGRDVGVGRPGDRHAYHRHARPRHPYHRPASPPPPEKPP